MDSYTWTGGRSDTANDVYSWYWNLTDTTAPMDVNSYWADGQPNLVYNEPASMLILRQEWYAVPMGIGPSPSNCIFCENNVHEPTT